MIRISGTVMALIMGGIIGLIIAIFSNNLPEFNINDLIWVYVILGISLILIITLISAVQNRVNEMSEEIEKQKSETKRIDEKLKIYKRLSKIEERLKI